MVVYAVSNDVGHPRLGVTASRRVGNAVIRNRWKRRLREIFRRGKEHFGADCDVVLIVKGGRQMPSFDRLRDDVHGAVKRAVGQLRRRGDKR